MDFNSNHNTTSDYLINMVLENAPGYSVSTGTSLTTFDYDTFTNAHQTGVFEWYASASALTIYDDTFSGNGGGGVVIAGSNTQILSSTFDGNGGGFPDNTSDGQLFLNTTSNAVTVTSNVFNGNNLYSGSHCVRGIEGYGANHYILGNTFQYHSCEGIYEDGIKTLAIDKSASGVKNMIISNGLNAPGPGFTSSGIKVWNYGSLGTRSSPFWCSDNITINNTTIQNNGYYGIAFISNGDSPPHVDGPILNISLSGNTITGNGNQSNGGVLNPILTTGTCP